MKPGIRVEDEVMLEDDTGSCGRVIMLHRSSIVVMLHDRARRCRLHTASITRRPVMAKCQGGHLNIRTASKTQRLCKPRNSQRMSET